MQFGLVHAVKVSRDGIVYVADRTIAGCRPSRGREIPRQVKLPSDTDVAPVPAGFAFSQDPKQQYLYVVDSGPMRVVIFDRATMTADRRLGMRGPKPGDFDIVHHMAADSKGNLYTAEIVTNRRAQRFVLRHDRGPMRIQLMTAAAVVLLFCGRSDGTASPGESWLTDMGTWKLPRRN